MSSRLSSRLSVCPPLVRLAPGCSSFLSLPVPLPPAYSALDGDDVGDCRFPFVGGCILARPLCAVASVARLCSSVSFASVGSSVSSRDSLHLAGSRRLPSHSVVPVRRSVVFHQGKCCNVSSQRGRGVAVASLSTPSVAPTQSSSKVILNRQVIIVDLGLASSCVIIDSGSVVGSQVSGRQPQQMPSSLHCVLRLRGGASSSISSDDGDVVGDDDVSGASSVNLVNGAAGSGFGNDRGILNGGGRGTASRVSAGVFAKEEGRMSRVFDHAVGQERLLGSIRGRNRRPALQPSIVEGYGYVRVDLVFSFFFVSPCLDGPEFRIRLFGLPFVVPGDVSSASSSGCPRVVGERQDGNLGRSATLNDGVVSTPSSNRVVAGSVKEDLAVRSFAVRSFVLSWPGSCRVFVNGPPNEMRMVGRQWVEPDPISHEWSAWYKPNIRRPVLSRSASSVNPPSVGRVSENVSVDRDGWREDLRDHFDDILLRSYGYLGSGK